MSGKIKLALKLYPFYEATSGDLLFFSVIQTLFLIQVKGFSAAQIAMIILVADIVDMALEYPSYRAIQRLGNSRACVIGGIMPLLGILFITIGQSLPLIVIGRILFVSAGNFQSMAGAAARNNLVMVGEKEQYAKLFSKGNTIYSAASMAAAVLVPFLFSINRYIPSVLCIVTCAAITAISFFIKDYTEQSVLPESKEEKPSRAKIGKGLWLLLVVFCLFFCSGAVFANNTEIFLTNRLGELVTEQNTIFIFGAVMWLLRMVRLGTNVLLPKILDRLKDKIVIIAASVMMSAFLVIGISALAARKSMTPVLLAGIAYVLVKGIFWDPLRTFLRMTAVDTNSKNKQQSMLMLLNAGQSAIGIIMDLIVVGVLKAFSLEYVFLIFALINCVTVVCAMMLRRELKNSVRLLHYESVLNEGEIDIISNQVFDGLKNAGLNSKEALLYRILTEEKLMECMNEGLRNEKLTVSLNARLDEFNVCLRIGEEERDIFTLPTGGDSASVQIFQNILRNMS